MMRYEWKKIFERRLNVLAMLSGYLLIGVVVFSYISQERFYDAATDSYVEGIEAYRMEQELARLQTDVITEEYVTELIGDIQSRGMDLESDEAYAEIIRPLDDMFYFVSKNYTDMRKSVTDLSALSRVDLRDGAKFYEHRMEKITDYLNMDFSYGNYTEAEKAYWLERAEHTNIPFRWGSKTVMSRLWELIFAETYLWFVVVICTSSVFSSEYESGAAYLLLTTKYGKDKLVWSKIGVSVLFTVGYLMVGALLALVPNMLFLGLPGADLPVQLWNSVIPYNITIGQTCLGGFGLGLLIAVTIALTLLCCSAGFRSSMATLVIGAAVIIAPMFFPMSKESGLWNHINYLFPGRAFNLKEMIGLYVSYAAGNVVISYAAMVVIVYVVISITALLLIRRMFVRVK
ncbi:MAG: hypothetical protein K2L82_08865 [Lachnospiraceae bacterium]|nr:hypothetical protein [Lachnospiraceae bacterium]